MEPFFETARECWSVIHSGGWPELGWWSYLLLALLVSTEGPVSTLLGAAAAATGILDIRYVFLSAFLGNVLGDCLWYSVGYVNDLKQIHRFGSWFGMRSHHIDRLETEMHAHAKKLIALSKLAIGLIIPTLVAAGLARVPWRRWFPLVLLIEIMWTSVMVVLGFHGAGLITQLERGLQMVGAVAVVLIAGGIIWYGRRFFAQNEAAMATGSIAIAETTSNTFGVAPTVTALDAISLGDNTLCATTSTEHIAGLSSNKALPVQFTTYKHNTYKQLVGCLFAPRLFTKASSSRLWTRRSSLRKSVMNRAVAGKSTLSLASSRSPRTIQVHFAGD